MVPYFEVPAWRIGSFTLHPFGLLVGIAIATAYFMARARAARCGLSQASISHILLWMLIPGFIAAHMTLMIIEQWPQVAVDPLLLIWPLRGIRSFGGLLGGMLGAVVAIRRLRLTAAEAWKYLDGLAFVFPFAWAIGRMGCALAHDHVGRASTSWLAVRFPVGPRYDLGLVEMLFALLLGVLFLSLDRRARAPGFYFALFFLVYGLFRVWLDGLHESPPRLGPLTYDEWGGWIAALAGGAIFATFPSPRQRAR